MQVENNTGSTKFAAIAIGSCFEYKGKLYMRVDMVGMLCNSSVVKSINERGDGYAVNLEEGTVSRWTQEAYVNPIVAKVRVTG